jgi:CRP-like cAMP-binding protein
MPNGKSISDLFGPGSVVGVAWSAIHSTSPYTTMALEECEVEQADAGRILEHLRHDPGTALDLLRYVSRQSSRLLGLFYKTAGKVPSDARLLETLREISAGCGAAVEAGMRITLPLPVQVLAELIGCSRQWASKLLGRLERQGTIKRKGSWITLVEPAQS